MITIANEGVSLHDRILLVDDEEATLFTFARLLRRLDCVVDSARSLVEAEAALSANEYSVVITDLRLDGARGEDGLEVLRSARAKSATVEIIVITGYGSPSAMTKAYELGAAYYFEKPV